jgi:LysM repeat protein
MHVSIIRIFIAALIIMLPLGLSAEEKNEYVIKQGDTLWEISGDKLGNPFLWSEIWKANPKIKNPHMIFPGQKLNIPGEPEKEEKEEVREVAKAAPKIIVPEKIAPKKVASTKREYLVPREILLQSGYISETATTAGKISGAPQKRTLYGKGDYVYIETDKPAAADAKFYIIGKPEKIIHPSTKLPIGHLIRVRGIAQTAGEDNGAKKALILESYDDIMPGDMLTHFYPIELPVEPVKEKRPAVSGTIITLWEKRNVSALGDIIYLDKGSADGIEIGDTFGIITKEKPSESIGTAQIITIKEKTSTAIVRKSTSEIRAGDIFKN